MTGTTISYTFVCLGDKQVATTMDLQVLTEDAYRLHAIALLRAHGSASAVEVWTDGGLIELIHRDGVRVWPEPADEA
ncbi:hypothetical protein CFHF_07780 [Caulobacter flavus]|uniref:Uncharacterized protein n=1 Tax=Caulobacter flavus TaxID=1679497 RepID=A0A2N5CVZ9_9CAUL|nr:hypothetical protein [Caulobacter flavus]AYV48236.1 hypothetical protein C1707_19310 [Caulobacter flavus]PLR17988.1 hypothetical protein CFHF_07780 [Caulobacter flavus]